MGQISKVAIIVKLQGQGHEVKRFFVCLIFKAAQAIFQLSGGCHHYLWHLWLLAVRVLLRATLATTRDLSSASKVTSEIPAFLMS
jgi:hypothetical protein